MKQEMLQKTMMLALFLFILTAAPFCAEAAQVCAAPGSSGPANISGIINSYYPGRASVFLGSMSIPVGSIDTSGSGSSAPIAAGDLLLVFQIQDADINSSNSSFYGGSSPGQGYSSLNSAGAYEYATATGPVSAGSVPISSGLLNSYHQGGANSFQGQRTFQVIRVPQYSSATLVGTVTAPPWNGATGGVVAIEAAGNLNWNGRSIDVNGRGFRGGGAQVSNSNGTGVTLNNTDYACVSGTGTLNLNSATAGSVPNGAKGEGIAGTPVIVFVPTTPNNDNTGGTVINTGGTDGISGGYPGGSFCRGAPGNAGGGGTDGNPNATNDQNTGGAGGGNFGPGGTGGFGWTPLQPPGSQTGGFGGGSVPDSPSRLFFGGGGGAATTNNGTSTGTGVLSSGAAGGGIVLVRAKTTTSSGSINANGANGNISAAPPSAVNGGIQNDAAGGGGAGGSVLVLIDNGMGSTGATINVNGGKGGNNAPGTANNCPHGPGGGGSGGYAVVSGSTIINFAGGTNGLTCSSPWTSGEYGSTTSPGGYQQVNLGPADIPGVMASPECYPLFTVTKSTATPNANQGGLVTYTITATNQSGYGTAAGVAINDILPNSPDFTYAATTSVVLAGGATRTVTSNPAAGSTAPSWGAFLIPGGGSVTITFTVNVALGTALGIYQNPATVTYDDPTATAAGQKITPGGTYAGGGIASGSNYDSASSANEDVTVRQPATFNKSFTPDSIAINGTTVLTVTVNNPTPVIFTGSTFSDNYPAGLVNAAVPAATTTCSGGVVTATPGATFFSLSGATVPAGGNCQVQVTLTAPGAGPFTNSIPPGALTNAQNITNVAVGSGTLKARPAITKSFSPVAVPQNTSATMTFAITNTNAFPLTNIAFTDSYPANLVNATPLTTGGTCTGVTTSASAGGSTFNVTAGTVAANSSCTITIQVRSAVAGNYPNSTSGVTSTETPSAGNPSNTAGLGVGVITVNKQFVTSPIRNTGAVTSQVILTLYNPIGIGQTGGQFTDTLTNMQIAAPLVVGGTCTGVTPNTLTAGQTSLSFTGINIPAGSPTGSCTISFYVTSSTAGTNPNTTSGVYALPVNTTGPASNTANLVVLATPTISKAYIPAGIQTGGTSAMQLTITNPNSVPLTGISFTDSYNANVKNAAPLNIGGSCTGVTVNGATIAGGTVFNVTAGTVPASSSCTITVPVTSNVSGSYPNTTSGVSSATTTAVGLGAGTVSNTATLFVVNPPNVTSKTFSPATIAQNGVSTLTVTLQNNNAMALTNVNFTDALVNMAVANPPVIGGSCVGATSSPPLAAGATSLNLTVPGIAAGSSCTVTVPITSATSGANTNQTSGATATESPVPGSPSPVATLNVLRPPQLAKDFSPGQITVGGTTTMRFTVTNPNSAVLNNIQFTDALSNMTVASTSFSKTCSGAVSFSPVLSVGGTQVNPTLSALNANESCTISVIVTSNTISPAAGHANTTGVITSTETPVSTNNASTSLDVLGPVTIAKAFTPGTIQAGGVSTITFTLTNPNASAMTGASFTDVFPLGLTTTNVVQTYTRGTKPCSGMIPNAKNTTTNDDSPNSSATPKGIIAGISIPANDFCTITVDVTSAGAGSYINTSSGVTTFQVPAAGPGASASLTVLARPTVTKAFGTTTIVNGGNTTLTLTLTNPNATPLTGVAISDTYPTNLRNLNTTTGGTCTGTITASPNGTNPGTLTLTGGALAANSSCTIIATVTSTNNATYTNTTGGVTSNETPTAGPTASDTLTVAASARLVVTKSFSSPTLQITSGQATLSINIANNTGTSRTDVVFTDTFPTTPGQMRAVGGAVTLTTVSGPNCSYNGSTANPTFNMPNIAANATTYTPPTTGTGLNAPDGSVCRLSWAVYVPTAGLYTNSTGGASSPTITAGGGDSAQITGLAPPAITKAFSPATIGIDDTSTITFTLSNTAANTVNYTGATFTDALNANLSIAGNQAAGGSCVGAGSNNFTDNQGGTLTFSGLTIPGGGSCSVTVIVKRATAGVPGTYANTTSGVTTAQTPTAGAGATSVNLIIRGTTLTKAFSPASVQAGTPSTLTFTITNGANNPAQTGLQFTDTLTTTPGNLLVASPTNATTTCGSGSVAAVPGANSIALSNGTLSLGQTSCTVSVDVVTATTGTYNNVAANMSGLSTGMTNSVNATLTVNNTPILTKAFSRSTVGIAQTTNLVFSINNPAGQGARTGLAFTDTLPAGLTIANPTAPSTTCTGVATYTAANGSQPFTVSGIGVPAGPSTCTVTISVRGAALGVKTNGAAQISGLTGLNNGVTSQSIEVVQPTVAKTFGAAGILSGGSTSLLFTLTNGNGNPPQGGITIGDTLPTGLRLSGATPAVTYGSGCSGPASATYTTATRVLSGLTGVAMSDGTASCTVSVAGVSNQTGSAGICPVAPLTNVGSSVTTTNAANGSSDQCLSVTSNTTVTKTFGVANIASGGATTLTLTLNNPTGAAITLTSDFVDTLPAGMTITSLGAGSCTGVTNTATTITKAGGSTMASGNCTIIANVTSGTPGAATNIIPIGALQTTVGSNAAVATATVNIYAPLTVTKAFGDVTIAPGSSTTLALTLGNPAANVAVITTAQVEDNFPAGLTLQNITFTFTPAACGTVTRTSGAASAAADNNVRFTAASIAPGATCKVDVNVTSSTVGNITNTTIAPAAAGPVALTGSAANASLNVNSPLLSVLKSASPATANPGQLITYTVNVLNSASGIATSVVLTDQLSPYVAWSLDGYGAGLPFNLTQGAIVSGLTLGAMDFSATNGSTWGYTPASGSGGAPAGYDGNVTNWKLNMNGTMNAGNAAFILNYKVMVK